ERHALRAAEPTVESLNVAVVADLVYTVEARSGGAADVEVLMRSPRQMVRRDRGFNSRVHENLPCGTDLEDRAAAIADVEIALRIEADTGRHAHAFHEHRHIARLRHLIDNAIETAGNVEQ